MLGSWELNLLVILLEILGAPVERFMENLRLLNDIVLVVGFRWLFVRYRGFEI